jgi:hypothetical protein
MEKMKNVPEIRFKGFEDEWEEVTFENLFDGLSNNSLSREKLNYNLGNIKNIHYGDIIVKYDDVINVKKEVYL